MKSARLSNLSEIGPISLYLVNMRFFFFFFFRKTLPFLKTAVSFVFFFNLPGCSEKSKFSYRCFYLTQENICHNIWQVAELRLREFG